MFKQKYTHIYAKFLENLIIRCIFVIQQITLIHTEAKRESIFLLSFSNLLINHYKMKINVYVSMNKKMTNH